MASVASNNLSLDMLGYLRTLNPQSMKGLDALAKRISITWGCQESEGKPHRQFAANSKGVYCK